MKYSLPNPTSGRLLLAIGLLAVAKMGADAAEPSGQQLVSEAAARLALQPAVSAKIRQRARLFGQEVAGSGSYQQVLAEGRMQIRLELKLQIGEELTTLQQVSDGVILWIQRDHQAERTVSHVNLRRIADALRNARDRASPLPSSGEMLAVGGIPQLLQGLDRNFDFGQPTQHTLANVPVWVVRGQWKKERLAELLPGRQELAPQNRTALWDALPAHLPDVVTVVLGRDDFIPLFPYRIEYGRHQPAETHGPNAGGAGERTVESVVIMEFFEVRRQWDIDPRAFTYQLGSQAVEDHTELYLQRMGIRQPAAKTEE